MATSGVSFSNIAPRQPNSLRLVTPPAVTPYTPVSVPAQPRPTVAATGHTTLAQLTSNGLPLPTAPSNLPQQPGVIADNADANLMPFYDVLETVLPPTSLQITNLGQRAQEQSFVFLLSLQQVNQVTTNRYWNEAAKRVEYPIQVQLRCLKILSGPQSDAFPTGVSCRVNKQSVSLPAVIPTNKPNAEPQRPGRPINLTPLCRLSPKMPNLLQMGYNYDSAVSYCVQIHLVRALTPEDLIDRIRERGPRPAEFSRAMIREKLSPSDCELAVTELVASLKCPLGKMRISIPMRSSACSHVQCFDAYSYLAMNAKKPVWKCPFCDQAAPYSQLYIDGYFQDVLASQQSAGLDRLQFLPNGSWAPAGDYAAAATAAPAVNTESSSSAKPEPAAAGSTAAASVVGNQSGAPTGSHFDLTLSDDETTPGGGGGGADSAPVEQQQQQQQAPSPQAAAPAPPAAEPIVINLDSSDEEN